MRKYLLSSDGNNYKANLHTHSTVSDGCWSPEKIKDEYQKKGYSIIAYTDHDVMVPHNDLSDENFLAITATEIYINDNESVNTDHYVFKKVYHLNFLSKDPNKNTFPGWNEKFINPQKREKYVTAEMAQRQEERHYDTDCVNDIIKRANEEGLLVTLNHPSWSIQDFTDYGELKGLWGVEVHNTGCVVDSFLNDTTQPLDDLLRRAQPVVPLATDDNHNYPYPVDEHDSFGGWTVVKAKELTYPAVMDALEKGDVYSSTGPEIKEIYIEDGVITVNTSPCRAIAVISENRFTRVVNATTSLLTTASLHVAPYFEQESQVVNNWSPYLRVEIVDDKGYHAWSRAYSLDELK
ncbi:MAG: PHP domain-containing protein [Clostridia bacterium]|nr:PHP domain-containing protein [Clostridia bacterium]MBQ7224952.1 PHP domain-containing protein [Clostridia bacterium]